MSDKFSILIVDDRPEGLMSLEAILQRPNYNIVTANSGEEALARVLDHDFCVIIMDVQMPGMDGFDTVRMIKQRERSKDIPVIFMTANNKDTHFVHRGYEGGAVDYIFKPFDPLILKSKVSIFVDLYFKNMTIREQGERLRKAEIRERGRQLAALQLESLNRYRHLADAVPHTMWKLRSEGSLEYCNRWWIVYSGLSLEQSSGIGWQSAVHKDDLNPLLMKLSEARKKAEPIEAECRLLSIETNSYRWHIFRAVPELSNQGEVEAWIVTNTDIEDRKQIEIDLIRAKEESLAASQAKSAFLANMSHEIRTPLGIVLGFAELLANPDIDSATREEYFDSVKRNGELLSQLIGDILDLSKIEAGRLEVEKIQFSLPDFLNSAIQSFQHQAKQKNVEIKTIVEGSIPTMILSDPTRLRQILFNVVSNAIKFTDNGNVIVRVRMSPEPGRPELLEIFVTDQGIGITEDQAKKLFQPFIQAHSSTTRKYGGTGLGLALSRRLALQLGGDIALDNAHVKDGTTFVVRMNVGPLEGIEFTTTLDHRTELKLVPNQAENLSGMKVLIVEDAPENQFLLKYILTRAGAEVATADNGKDGVDRALNEEFDIILMDIQMPILDGYQAARILRDKDYRKPILALTAYALKEERERCLSAGCDDHLTKPINRTDLLQRMRKYTVKKTANA